MAVPRARKRENLFSGVSNSLYRWLNGTSSLWPPRAEDWGRFGAQSVVGNRTRAQKIRDDIRPGMDTADYVDALRKLIEPLMTTKVSDIPGAKAAAEMVRTIGLSIKREFIEGGRQVTTVSARNSRQSVPVAEVAGLRPGPAVRAVVRPPSPSVGQQAQQSLLASQYADALAPFTKMIARGRMADAFKDGWSDLRFMVSTLTVGSDLSDTTLTRDYSVCRGEGFVGVSAGHVMETPEKTMESAIRTLRNSGMDVPGIENISTLADLRRMFVYDPTMQVGSPLLLRDASLVRAAKISRFLSVAALEEAFLAAARKQFDTVREAMRKPAGIARGEDLKREAVRAEGLVRNARFSDAIRNEHRRDLEERRARYEAKVEEASFAMGRSAAGVTADDVGFGLEEGDVFMMAGVQKNGLSDETAFIRYVEGIPLVYEIASDVDGMRSERWRSDIPDLSALPPGRYRAQNSFGHPDGLVSIDTRGVAERIGHFTAEDARMLRKPAPTAPGPRVDPANDIEPPEEKEKLHARMD